MGLQTNVVQRGAVYYYRISVQVGLMVIIAQLFKRWATASSGDATQTLLDRFVAPARIHTSSSGPIDASAKSQLEKAFTAGEADDLASIR